MKFKAILYFLNHDQEIIKISTLTNLHSFINHQHHVVPPNCVSVSLCISLYNFRCSCKYCLQHDNYLTIYPEPYFENNDEYFDN